MKSAVILAGGRSTRMEFDKCTVPFHGKPLMFWSYSVLKDLAQDVLISISKDRDVGQLQEFIGNDVRFIRDDEPGLGPLHGMLLSFRQARGDYVAVAPATPHSSKRSCIRGYSSWRKVRTRLFQR